jgi:imidazole glycerol-phosphate synthase subunit HisH
MITIVDYNIGNLASIRNMLKKLGVESEISADPAVIARANKLILPGVGAFDAGMQNLRNSGLLPVLNDRVMRDRVPTLGICLGMQLMTCHSEEGESEGLAWVDAEVLRFRPADPLLKVPHMGWNRVIVQRPSVLVDDLPPEPCFYFVHSFHVHCRRREDVVLCTSYGTEFHSAFECANIWGVQFHPEKSHKFGMKLLQNFAKKCGSC